MSISDFSFAGSGFSCMSIGLLHHEHADIGDVLTDFQRLLIVVGLHRAHEDRPQPAIEEQRIVHVLVGARPVGLDIQKLSRSLQQRLRLDFTGDAVVCDVRE